MIVRVWMGALALALLGSAIALVDSAVRGAAPAAKPPAGTASGTAPLGAPPKPSTPLPQAAPPNSAAVDLSHLGPRIGLDQASALFDQGKIFVDAREPREFDEGRIPGAMNLPPDAFTNGSKEWNRFFQTYGKDEIIVVYCGGGDCHASESVAAFLGNAGFTHVHIFEAGFPGWTGAKKDVETGKAGG